MTMILRHWIHPSCQGGNFSKLFFTSIPPKREIFPQKMEKKSLQSQNLNKEKTTISFKRC